MKALLRVLLTTTASKFSLKDSSSFAFEILLFKDLTSSDPLLTRRFFNSLIEGGSINIDSAFFPK